MGAFLTHLINSVIALIVPGLGKFAFGSVVKKAGTGVLNKAPLDLHAPNLLVSTISVLAINGLNFFVMLFLTDSNLLSMISAGSVTVVTAFFLLRGFFSPRTKRERITLLIALIVFFGLFVFFLLVAKIVWLALVAKLTLEVILCFAVMSAELNRLNKTQAKVFLTIMRKLRISPRKPLGKLILWIGGFPRIIDEIRAEED